MEQLCLRCSTPVLAGAEVCPKCGLNIGKIKKTLGEFLPSGGLQQKIRKALNALESQQMTPDELEHRLQVEWQLVAALIEKYRHVRVPQLASVSELLVRALALYQQALLALGEEGNAEKSLSLAQEADEYLVEMEREKENVELRYPQPDA